MRTYAQRVMEELFGWTPLPDEWSSVLDEGQLWETLVAKLLGGRVSPRCRAGYDVVTRSGRKLEVKHCSKQSGGRGWKVSNMKDKEDCVIFCLNRSKTKVQRIFFLPKGVERKAVVNIPQGKNNSAGERFWKAFELAELQSLMDIVL